MSGVILRFLAFIGSQVTGKILADIVKFKIATQYKTSRWQVDTEAIAYR